MNQLFSELQSLAVRQNILLVHRDTLLQDIDRLEREGAGVSFLAPLRCSVIGIEQSLQLNSIRMERNKNAIITMVQNASSIEVNL